MVSTGFGVWAGEDEFGRRLNASEQLHKQGAYAEAERQLLALLAETEAPRPGDLRKLAVLNNLGSVYHSMSRYSQAEQCYRRAIELEKAAGADAREFHLQSTVNLACLYIETGQSQKVRRLGLQALAESRPKAERNNATFARLMATLGGLEFSQGKLADAERHQLEALRIWEELEPHGKDRLELLSNLGILYLETGRHAEARQSYERVLALSAKALPAGDPENIRILMNAGTVHAIVDGPAAAEPFYRRALDLAQEKLGEEHPVVGSILTSYAVLLEGTGRKSQASHFRRRAQSLRDSSAVIDPRSYTVDLADLQRRR